MKQVTLDMVKRAKAGAVISSSMTKYETLREIRKLLLECPTSETEDVQDMYREDQVSSKIYTKKLYIGADKDEEVAHPEDMKIVKDFEFVSLSCSDPEFKTCLVSDIRINNKNAYNEWVNVFASSMDMHVLRFLLCLMKEIMGVEDITHDEAANGLFEEFTEWVSTLKVKDIKDISAFGDGFRTLRKACL